MTLLDPNPEDPLEDPYGLKDGWWYYIKQFFCYPHNIFTRRKKRKEVNFEFEEERRKL